MYRLLARMSLFMFFLAAFSSATTIMADVTGDGVDDEIKVGEQSVVVEDGKSSKKHVVISDEEMLHNVIVDDYSTLSKGKEIAVIVCPGADCITEIYGFKSSQFDKISATLPGEVIVSEQGELIGHQRHFFEEGGWIYLPYPLTEVDGSIVSLEPTREIENTISVDANSSKDILIECSKNQMFVIGVVVHAKNVIVAVYDSKGMQKASVKIDTESPFVYYDRSSQAETITLSIDNSYSILTPKTVTYVVIQF